MQAKGSLGDDQDPAQEVALEQFCGMFLLSQTPLIRKTADTKRMRATSGATTHIIGSHFCTEECRSPIANAGPGGLDH